jgi:hypothetical protein
MVKVSIEVRYGTARLDVAVRAWSIQQAMSFVRERYPNTDVRVRFPLDPEGFFVQDPAARAGLIEDEQPDLRAA